MSQNEKTKRNEVIDILKGIGIFCVVAGHCSLQHDTSPVIQFIYLFHVAVFFIASGYCYNPSKTDSTDTFKCGILRTFKKLWTPYVFWTILFLALHNLFVNLNIYTDNPAISQFISGEFIHTTNYLDTSIIISRMLKALVFLSGTQLTGPLWFLATLLELVVLYQTIDFVLKKVFSKEKAFFIQSVLSFVFLAVGYVLSLKGIFLEGFARVPSFYILLHGGHFLKKYSISEKKRSPIVHLDIWAISFAILFVSNCIGSIELSKNEFVNPVFLVISSFAGWQFLYETSYFIKRFNLVQRAITYIGKNSIPILALQFLCFKLVTVTAIKVNGHPGFELAAFPVLYDNSFWWLPYTIAGIAIPLFVNSAWNSIKKRLVG